MTDLKNEFSWSPSRDKCFTNCPRAYWYRHYGSWGGWEDDAPEEARLAYRLKQVTSLAAWAGKIVHDVIEQALRMESRRGFPSEQDLCEQGRMKLTQQWFQSLDKAWTEKPKKFTNLLEHYYGHTISKHQREEIREKVFRCLRTFRSSSILEEILSCRQGWQHLEDLLKFKIEDVTIYAKPDFALQESRFVVYDWKTGKPRPEDEFQVTIYALLAERMFQAEDAEVVLFYLDTGQVSRRTPTPDDKKSAQAHVLKSAKKLRALYVGDDVPKEACPMKVSRRCARWCEYYELCRPEIEGTGPVPAPAEEDDEEVVSLFD